MLNKWITFAVALGFPVTLLGAPPAGPDAFQVEVINTPLPVEAAVTGSVEVNNFPVVQEVSGNVNAAVTGSVDVNNFPAVQPVSGDVNAAVTGSVDVNNFPAVQAVSGNVSAAVTGEVTIGNTPSVNVANTPLEVVVTNETALREPYQLQASGFEPGGGFMEVQFAPVPEGKLFEIKHVSSFNLLDIDSWMYCSVQVMEPPSTIVGKHHVIIQHDNGTYKDMYTASTPITLFADSGQVVEYECVFSDQADSVVMQVSLSGYLIDN